MFLKCPKEDNFLQVVSVPDEISAVSKFFFKAHLAICSSCRLNFEKTQATWMSFLKPEPEITSSILKVYSRLQNDETLILKGWKLGKSRKNQNLNGFLFQEGWLFRGSVFLGVGVIVAALVFSNLSQKSIDKTQIGIGPVPFAQIRQQEKNKVKVHYLQPELLHTIEFETTGGAR